MFSLFCCSAKESKPKSNPITFTEFWAHLNERNQYFRKIDFDGVIKKLNIQIKQESYAEEGFTDNFCFEQLSLAFVKSLKSAATAYEDYFRLKNMMNEAIGLIFHEFSGDVNLMLMSGVRVKSIAFSIAICQPFYEKCQDIRVNYHGKMVDLFSADEKKELLKKLAVVKKCIEDCCRNNPNDDVVAQEAVKQLEAKLIAKRIDASDDEKHLVRIAL